MCVQYNRICQTSPGRADPAQARTVRLTRLSPWGAGAAREFGGGTLEISGWLLARHAGLRDWRAGSHNKPFTAYALGVSARPDA